MAGRAGPGGGPHLRRRVDDPHLGSAAQVDQALDVGLEQYRLPSGRVVQVPDAEPLVPGALADDFYGVAGLDDLSRPVPELARATEATGETGAPPGPSSGAVPAPRSGGPTPTTGCESAIQSSGSSAGAVTADQLASAYSFSSLYPGTEGSGVTVGIYELEPFLPSDINTFKNCYSPAISASVNGVGVDHTSPNAGAGQGEAALDIEMVIGMAPNVNAKVYVGPNAGSGPLDTYAAMVNGNNPPPVISTSWGQCEAQLSAAVHRVGNDDLRTGGVPGPDRHRRLGRRRIRGLLPLPELHRQAPAGRRSRQPAVGDRCGRDDAQRPRTGADRVGVEHRAVLGRVGWGELDDVDHAGMAARPRGPERGHQGARRLHRGAALPDELGRRYRVVSGSARCGV